MGMNVRKASKNILLLVPVLVFLLVSAWPCSVMAGSGAKGNIAVFDFHSAPLAEVLQLFTELTGKNVVATPEIQGLEISLYLQAVDPKVALETLCKNYNLWYTEESSVIRVMQVEEYGRELVLRRDEKTRVFNLKYASCLALADAVSRIFGDKLKYDPPKDVQSYGHVGTDKFPSIGEEISISGSGGGTGTVGPKGGRGGIEAGGVYMQKEDLTRLRQIAAAGGEVSVEELLQYRVGQALGLLTVFPRNNAIIARSVDTRLLDDVEAFIKGLDTPTRQVMLECKILEIALGDGFDSFFDLSITPGGKFYGRDDVGRPADLRPDTKGITGIDLLNVPSLAESTLKFVFIDKQLQARFEMLEKTDRVRKIATPLALCANNASAKFFQGVESPVRKGYTVTDERRDAEGNVTASASVRTDYSMEELGVTLEIAPLINMDRTVTLKIATEVSTLNLGGGPPFNYTVGGVPQVGQTDTMQKTVIEDIIVAMDGQTLALGGLIQEEDITYIKKVPVLGDIPLLSFFFRSTGIKKEQKEIVFCITPHIIMAPDETEAVNERIMKDLSEHPFYRDGSKRILRYDRDGDVVESFDQAANEEKEGTHEDEQP